MRFICNLVLIPFLQFSLQTLNLNEIVLLVSICFLVQTQGLLGDAFDLLVLLPLKLFDLSQSFRPLFAEHLDSVLQPHPLLLEFSDIVLQSLNHALRPFFVISHSLPHLDKLLLVLGNNLRLGAKFDFELRNLFDLCLDDGVLLFQFFVLLDVQCL